MRPSGDTLSVEVQLCTTSSSVQSGGDNVTIDAVVAIWQGNEVSAYALAWIYDVTEG
jgi:hypothetical protein